MNMPFIDGVQLLSLPWGVVAAVLLGGFVFALSLKNKKKPAVTLRFANLALISRVVNNNSPSRLAKWTAWVLITVGIASVGLSTARPATAVEKSVEQGTLCVIWDRSNSMMWHDVHPSRIEASRQVIKEAISATPAEQQVMVVTFAGRDHVDVLIEPTLNKVEALARVDEVETGPNTAAGLGIYAAVEELQSQDNPILPEELVEGESLPVECILLADGATDQGETPQVAAQAAAEVGLKIHAVSFGYEEGSGVVDGERIRYTPDPESLGEVAAVTGGEFYKDVSSAGELQQIFDSITSSLATETEFDDVGYWFSRVAMLTLIPGMGISFWKFGWFTP